MASPPPKALVDLLWPIGACVFFSASALVASLRLAERAERVLGVALVANALAVLPIYALGAASALTRTSLGLLLVVVTVAVAAATRKMDREVIGVMRDVALAPPSVFRRAFRENAPVALMALATTTYVLGSLYAAYFAPTWRSYDAIWYHEPIVAFTIQNRGLAWVDVPPELDVVNANPRASEMLQVFFAIVGGRRVVDVASVCAVAGAGVAHYALFGRLTSRADVRIGFSASLLLVPAFFLQIGSTYIDVHVWGLLIAALYFAAGGTMTRQRLGLVATAAGLAIGAKATAYLPAGVIMLVALGRSLDPKSLARSGARGALVGALATALVVPTFVRNALHFGNPVYPVPISVPSLGIAWPGIGQPFDDPKVLEPFVDVWKNAAGQPGGDGKYEYPFYVLPHSVREAAASYNYGYAVAYVLVPFGFAALLFLGLRLFGSPALGLSRRVRGPLSVVAVLFVAATVHYVSLRYLHLARYHGILLTLLAMAIVAACEIVRAGRWASALATATCGLGIVTLAIQTPRTFLLPTDVAEMMQVPYPERETTPRFGSPTTVEGGRLRFGFAPGSVIAYSENLQAIAPLWNDDYSNRVVFVHGDKRLAGELDAVGARYYVCTGYCTAHPEIFRTFAPRGPMFTFSTSAILYERRAP